MAGEKTAVEMALDGAPELSDEEQLDMLGMPPKPFRAPWSPAQKGPGRPPGARNKRTVEMVNYLSSQYRSPLEVLAVISNAGVGELAARLGCTKLEALQEMRIAASTLLPYWHQKMPLAVDLNQRVVHLNIFDDGERAGGDEQLGLGLVAVVAASIGKNEDAE